MDKYHKWCSHKKFMQSIIISHLKNVKKSDIIICILNYFISMSDGGQEDLVMLRRVVYCLIVSLLLWTSMFILTFITSGCNMQYAVSASVLFALGTFLGGNIILWLWEKFEC